MNPFRSLVVLKPLIVTLETHPKKSDAARHDQDPTHKEFSPLMLWMVANSISYHEMKGESKYSGGFLNSGAT